MNNRRALRWQWVVVAAISIAPFVVIGCGDDDGGAGGGAGGGVGGGVGGGTGADGGVGGGGGNPMVDGGGAGGGGGGGPMVDAGNGNLPDGGAPSVCTNVAGPTCTIDCSAAAPCADTLVCPAGFDCQFTCNGDSACDGVTLDCATNDNTSCGWNCSGGAGTCESVTCIGDGCEACMGNRCP